MRMSLLGVLTTIGVALGTFGMSSTTAAQTVNGPSATAEVYDAAGADLGTATLWQVAEGVRLDATLHGVAPGWHTALIDSGGQCDPPAFARAMARYAPLTIRGGRPIQVQRHDGDLVNVDDAGVGPNFQPTGDTLMLHGLVAGASLGPGDAALLSSTGAALVLLGQRSSAATADTSADADGGIACGAIVSVGAAQDGATFASQSPDTQAEFRSLYGDQAAQEWVRQHDAQTAQSPEFAEPTADTLATTADDAAPDVPVPDMVCPTPTSDPRNACELTAHAAVSGAITDAGGMHVYRFSVASPRAVVDARLLNLATDYDLYLLDDSGNPVDQSVHEGTSPETIDALLQPGEYFLYVYAGLPVPQKAPYELLFDIQAQ